MAAKHHQRTEFVGVRLTTEELKKVRTLAFAGGRTVSQLFRLLLAQARASGTPDVVLSAEYETLDREVDDGPKRNP